VGPVPRRDRHGRMEAVQTPVVPLIARLVAATPGAVSLAQGMVAYPPPAAAIRAAAEAGATAQASRYGPVDGLPELRRAIAGKLARDNGIDSRAGDQRIMVTAGANMAFVNAVLAITEPGDEVILPQPYYFNHEMSVRMLGCTPVAGACDAAYVPRVDALAGALTARTRAIVTVSPNNPTGAVYPPAVIAAIDRLCREAGLYHIRDEAYEYFRYDGGTPATPGDPERSIHLYSLSKSYGFAGWRIGYMLAPAALHEALLKAQDSNLICATHVAQAAAAACLATGPDYCRARLPELERGRDALLQALRPLAPAVTANRPEGAFYVMLSLPPALEDFAVARRLVEEFGVGVIPGSAFGITEGCSLRVSYGALTGAALEDAVARLAAGLDRITAEHAGGQAAPGRV